MYAAEWGQNFSYITNCNLIECKWSPPILEQHMDRIGIESEEKDSRSYPPILKAVPIQIKIHKKDLDPGFSDPLVRSSNTLEIPPKVATE